MDFLASWSWPFDQRLCQIFLSGFCFLAVTDSFCTTADVQNNFVQTWDLHVVLIAELFFHRSADRVEVSASRRGV